MSPRRVAPTQGKRRAPDSPDLGAYRTVRNRLEDTPGWTQALCRNMGTNLFFPERKQDAEAAKAICRTPRRSLNRGRDRRPRTARRGATLALPGRPTGPPWGNGAAAPQGALRAIDPYDAAAILADLRSAPPSAAI
jgi:hypothetical protein